MSRSGVPILQALDIVAGTSGNAVVARALDDVKAGVREGEALAGPMRAAVRTGMIPVTNVMAAAGIVSLPGMMTGQILAGADPMLAIRYQIVVLFMIVASTALSVVAILHVIRGRCFGPAQQPLLRPGISST